MKDKGIIKQNGMKKLFSLFLILITIFVFSSCAYYKYDFEVKATYINGDVDYFDVSETGG